MLAKPSLRRTAQRNAGRLVQTLGFIQNMNWLSKIFSRTDPPASAKPQQHGAVEFTPTAANGARTASVADNPIRKPADDRIGRARAAEHFAASVLRLDASEGLVVGVLGPWRSGKTSFVNLARPIFESNAVPVLDFNTWMFSGAEQLVQSIFSELSAQLKLKPGLAEVGKGLEEYGDIFSNLTCCLSLDRESSAVKTWRNSSVTLAT